MKFSGAFRKCFYMTETALTWESGHFQLFILPVILRDTAVSMSRIKNTYTLEIKRILPGHHRLSVPVTIIDEIETAFSGLADKGKLKQGNGIFRYDNFQIHI